MPRRPCITEPSQAQLPVTASAMLVRDTCNVDDCAALVGKAQRDNVLKTIASLFRFDCAARQRAAQLPIAVTKGSSLMRLPRQRISRCELAQMEGYWMNREHSATFRPYIVNKPADRALLGMVQHIPVKLPAGKAKGIRKAFCR